LIADIHFGVRNENKSLMENQVKFFENIFFPFIDKYEIKHVINLGDTVDRRKFVNFTTTQALTDALIKPLYLRGIESHFILGNHDVFYKDTNDLNAIEQIYGNSIFAEILKIYKNPTEINIGGLDILLLPWITNSNKELSFEALKNSKSTVLMGHLELAGFEMYRGSVSDHGMDASLLNNFDVVCSGHFHHKSTVGSINYLGSTGQYTWSDYGDARGFHIFDTETRLLEFIPNHYHMFNKFFYDDSNKSPEELLSFDASMYARSFVKVIVKNKTNPYLLEKVVEKLEKVDPVDLQVFEDKLQVEIENEEDLLDEAEDTLSIIKKYISSMNYNDKNQLEKFMTELFAEAIVVE
jgi:DNA repair exonuclease SbcCD nuclease subunit